MSDQPRIIERAFVAVFRRSPEFSLKEARRKIADHSTKKTAQETIQKTAQTTVQKVLAQIERKRIRRVGPDKGGQWEVSK